MKNYELRSELWRYRSPKLMIKIFFLDKFNRFLLKKKHHLVYRNLSFFKTDYQQKVVRLVDSEYFI